MAVYKWQYTRNFEARMSEKCGEWRDSFTKPPLLKESRLPGGGSPNLVDLVEGKVPVERNMGAANSFHSYYPWLYTCVVQIVDPNWFCAAVTQPPHTSSKALPMERLVNYDFIPNTLGPSAR